MSVNLNIDSTMIKDQEGGDTRKKREGWKKT